MRPRQGVGLSPLLSAPVSSTDTYYLHRLNCTSASGENQRVYRVGRAGPGFSYVSPFTSRPPINRVLIIIFRSCLALWIISRSSARQDP